MPRPTVRYYFAFGSPFAYLANTRIDAEVEAAGGELLPLPVLPPPATGPEPEGIAKTLQDFKQSYWPEDCARWARRLGVPFQMPAARDTPASDATDATAGWYFAREAGREREYRRAVFHAYWGEGKALADHEVLADAAARADLDREAFLESITSRRLHDEIPKVLQGALQDRVFGVPLFVVNGERYWGNDRIDFLVEALRQA